MFLMRFARNIHSKVVVVIRLVHPWKKPGDEPGFFCIDIYKEAQ